MKTKTSFSPEIYGRILINSFNIMSADNLPVGVGLYLEGSVFDHSCRPNATVVFEGKTLIVRTIRSGTVNARKFHFKPFSLPGFH